MGSPLSIGGRVVSLGGRLVGLPSAAGAAAAASLSTLGSIAGVTQWWDATTAAYAVDANGVGVGRWAGAAIGGLLNRVSGGPALQAFAGTGGTVQPLTGRGRINGALGGVGGAISTLGSFTGTRPPWPMLEQHTMLQAAGPIALPAAQDWWLALAWSRPNAKQQDSGTLRPAGEPSVLVQLGGTTLLALDNAVRATVSGADVGTLSVLGTAVSGGMALRHCATVLLVNRAGQGITAYVNGQQAASGIACPFGTAAAKLVVGGNGGDIYFGGAQVWFHEMAVGGSLSAGGVTQVLASLGRYVTGARPALLVPVLGQSNAQAIPNAAYDVARSVVSYLTGALSVEFLLMASPGGAMYAPSSNGNNCLVDAGVGSDPSGWVQTATGQSIATAIQALAPVYQADVGFILTYWTEGLSALSGALRSTYETAKPTFEGAWRNEIGYVRSLLPGRTAATAPVGFTRVVAFGSAEPAGVQMESDGFDELSADGSLHAGVVLQNTWACSTEGGATAPNAGASHFSGVDHINNFRVLGGPMARLLAATGQYGVTLPAAGVAGGVATTGPVVVRAQFCTAAGAAAAGPTGTVLVTIRHDTGTALLGSAYALAGAGWSVRDGWSGPSMRGSSIAATGVSIVDATHVLVTLASVPASAAGACRLMYCEGPGWLGTGNALTDNAGSVAAAPGFDIGADLGPALAPNYPVAMLAAGVGFT